MAKKPKLDEYEKLYKTLTKDKFTNLMMNLDMLNKALGHLAYRCHELNPEGGKTLQIPLEVPKGAAFKFQVFQNKITKQEVLSVEVLSEENTTH